MPVLFADEVLWMVNEPRSMQIKYIITELVVVWDRLFAGAFGGSLLLNFMRLSFDGQFAWSISFA